MASGRFTSGASGSGDGHVVGKPIDGTEAGKSVTPDGNKAVVQRLMEDYFNRRDEEVWDHLVRDDVVIHGAQGDLQGSEAATTRYRALWATVQPWQPTVVRLIERGTMVGRLRGMPPTGKEFT